MDFLFTSLPDSNFEMTDAQLVLWQRNAIFECDCDNLVNRRIEGGLDDRAHQLPLLPNILRRPLVEQSGIDMAIDQHGLHVRNADTMDAPAAQRPRLVLPNAALRPSMDFYQEAVLAALWGHGLGLLQNP